MFSLIETPRLLIRPLSPLDAAAVFAYRSLPEVSHYQYWEPQSPDEVAARIASMPETPVVGVGEALFGITLRESGHVIGDCCVRFTSTDTHTAEIGITLDPSFQRRGYASESLKALLDALFMNTGVHRAIASVDPRNPASMSLVRRVGMRQEALFIESCWFKGAWADDAVFAILRREWSNTGAF